MDANDCTGRMQEGAGQATKCMQSQSGPQWCTVATAEVLFIEIDESGK